MRKGALEKVRIYAYEDKDFNKENKKVRNPFYLPINPESYTKNFKVELDTRRGHGNQGTDPRFKSTAPEELKLDFFFDGTGTLENYHYPDKAKYMPVKQQLELFLAVVYRMEGNIHRPNFLKLFWGEYLKFPCVVSNLDLNYQLFDPSGDPLRVKVSATFLNYMAQKERLAREKKKSPDLTHERKVIAGDRLDLMTHDIYNDTRFLLQVARSNGLVTIRQLKPGQELRFPPIDKTETV